VTPRLLRAAAGALAVLPLLGCPSAPKQVAYDLARRAGIAERWSAGDVLLFGTPAAEPRQVEGFYREAGGGAGDPFLWVKAEAEVALDWSEVTPRIGILDLAPYRGVRDQSVEVRLNGTRVGQFRLNDVRHRYRIALPGEAQKPGENRLLFVFSGALSPSSEDPKNPDKRQLAAQLFSLVTGPASDPSLEDLLGRGAPRPFGVAEAPGAPSLSLVGPGLVRYAIRVPPGGELRFTPDLHPAARAAAGAASFRVTFEGPGSEGHPQELWKRVIGAGDAKSSEVVVKLPGSAGDIARVGLEVIPTEGSRFAWGVFLAPRILGRTAAADPLEPGPHPPKENARADGLRKALGGANVLLVILDAARARQFGAYGYGRPTTPEIDRIAAEGVVFEKAFTPAVYTLGAMSSAWTSQYPDRHHGDVSFSSPLPKDRLTLADVLSGQGILAAGFVANPIAGGFNRFDRGFGEFRELWRELGSTGGVFRQAVPGWLAKNKGRRFFAYLHFREPHFPYDPDPPFDTRFGPDRPIPKPARRDMAWITDVNQGRRPLTPEEREHLVRLYDGNLAFADQEVGALRRTLEAEGLWEKTVVIVAADHGEELFEHSWIGHNVQLYEPSVRVPLIVRFPSGTGPKGQRVRELVDLLDLSPTIADILGVLGKGGSDGAFQGRSLLPVVMGAPGKPMVLSRTVWDRPRYGLRDERYALVVDTRTREARLFDTAADPEEAHDLSGKLLLRTAYYRQTLDHWTRNLSRPARSDAEEAGVMTKEQCESLKSLGYLPAGFPCPGK
jgi:arylsulfatase A-like enzyme